MSAYRWNTSDFAVGYDAAADKIHPYYVEIQDAIIQRLPRDLEQGGLLIDLGGGSGRLVERILDAWPRITAVVLDQSEPFLALAERRLARFQGRATCVLARLQEDWQSLMPEAATAIVSMSAIHHLEAEEKQTLYRQCAQALAPGGVLMNGDEVRDADDAKHLAEQQSWADHMRRGMADGSIGEIFHPALHKWIDRNVTQFGQPKRSGDDCHETIQVQLDYYRAAGFATVDCSWQKGMWALMRGVLPR